MMNGNRPNILVLGGGFGGLETAFYLRMKLEDRANITLVSDRDYFLFKPNTIYIPFGLDPDRRSRRRDESYHTTTSSWRPARACARRKCQA